jgi:hypothetical protein
MRCNHPSKRGKKAAPQDEVAIVSSFKMPRIPKLLAALIGGLARLGALGLLGGRRLALLLPLCILR